jgi:hypothetical protein
MKRLFGLLFLFTLSIQGQIQINGIVKNSDTKKPLAFATITVENGSSTIADVDGKFNFTITSQPKKITISYVGFESKEITIVEEKSYYTIALLPKIAELKEVALSNLNPANAIITKVIQQKNSNNPQKKLNSFQFKSYNKLLVTANPDSIVGKIDTVFVNAVTKEKIYSIDSSAYKFKKIIDKQHLFLTEKVSQFQFEKPHLKETILGTKMAGFKEPIYE